MELNDVVVHPRTVHCLESCTDACERWIKRVQFMKFLNMDPQQDPIFVSDVASTLDILCKISCSEPALKTDELFLETVQQVIQLCSLSQYRDSERFVNLIDTCFESDDIAMRTICDVYYLEIRQNFGQTTFLQYLLSSCLEQNFDLFGCLSTPVKETDQDFWADSELIFSALHLGPFSDIVFLFRHGITLNDFTLEDDTSCFLPRSKQTLKACLIISSVLDVRGTCPRDLAQVLTACFDVAPYPFVNRQDMMLAELPNDMIEVYSRLLPHWAVGPRNPRSLKHLSRCAIRDQLHKCLQLPRGIYSLAIPPAMKHYLDLSEHLFFRCICHRWCMNQTNKLV